MPTAIVRTSQPASALQTTVIDPFVGRLTLSVKETGRALGIGRTKIHELISSGELQSIKIGNRRLITVRSIQEFLEARISEGAST